MALKGRATKYAGVRILDKGKYLVRARATCPLTGKRKEVERTLTNTTASAAARARADLVEEIEAGAQKPLRRRVGEFAQSWIKSKALKVSSNTARTYADSLEKHILPSLGDYYYDVLTSEIVQEWIDDSLLSQWRKGDKVKRYNPVSVHCWFRVFRTMTRDAMEPLRLERDPTLRVSFPCFDESVVSKAITAETLAKFLDAMHEGFPQHYALTVALAYTGMRFCHVSALKWSDWNENRQMMTVSRRQVRGEVAPVSRKKRAPQEYPVQPELAEVLRWHRHRMLRTQAPGLEKGWMFPSSAGTLRTPSSLQKAWKHCIGAAGIEKRFTVHGLRYTFNDLVRRANVDPIVRRALLGHVTEEMQRHYSNVGLDEKRAAVAGVIGLVPTSPTSGGTFGGTSAENDNGREGNVS